MATVADRGTAKRAQRLFDFSDSSDTVAFLTVYLVLLYAVPSSRSLAVLGSAGSISVLWGLIAMVLWILYRLQRPAVPASHRLPRVRAAALVLFIAVLLSYVAAMTRAIPPSEVSTADTGLIRVVAWMGILIIATDGIPSVRRLLALLRRLVLAASALAALGLVQSITALSFVDQIPFPGLSVNSTYDSVETRGGLVRASGTANHPLEYGMVLTMVFPVAVTLALRDRKRRVFGRWAPVIVIGLAILLSGSRSALIGLAVGLLVLIPSWSARIRLGALGAGVVLTATAFVMSPQTITTVSYLFFAVADDPSAGSRSASVDIVVDFISRSPVFGRGFGTLLPEYRILDNQLFLLAIEIGVVGLLAFTALVALGVAETIVVARTSSVTLEREIGFALASSLVSGFVLLALFDGLSFPQSAGTLVLMIGVAGAYARLMKRDPSS